MSQFQFRSEIQKFDEDKGLVYAWASVVEQNGEPVVDHQGDVIDEEDLEMAAFDFISKSRTAGEMHMRKTGVGEVVGSMVFTKKLQEQLGIDLGMVGWLVVIKVMDDEIKKLVKSGDYSMLSIGGSGVREEMS